jgi:hypothetical protein
MSVRGSAPLGLWLLAGLLMATSAAQGNLIVGGISEEPEEVTPEVIKAAEKGVCLLNRDKALLADTLPEATELKLHNVTEVKTQARCGLGGCSTPGCMRGAGLKRQRLHDPEVGLYSACTSSVAALRRWWRASTIS